MKNMKLSPIVLAGLGFILALLGLALALLAALSAPNLGFKVDSQNDMLVITEISPWLTGSGLRTGDIVTGFKSEHGFAEISPRHQRLGLGTNKLSLWQEVDHIRNILSSDGVSVTRQSGADVVIEPRKFLALSDLPANFWARCLYGVIALLVGLSLWIWRPFSSLNILGAAAGAGLMLAWIPSAPLLAGISLHFPTSDYAIVATSLQSLGILMFAASFVCIPFYFPGKLPGASVFTQVVCILAAAYAAFQIALNPPSDDWLELLLLEPRDIYLPIVPMLLVVTAGCAIQGYRNWSEPVARAQQLWFVFAASIGPTVWLLLYLLPSRYGGGPIIPISYAPLAILVSYIMAMVGIWRHPALGFEKHIETIYQWWLTSILFLGIDLALIYFAAFSPENALLATLAIMLWVYLPIRQWLVDKVSDTNRSSYRLWINRVISDLVEASFSQTPGEQAWKQALDDAFRPINIAHGDDGPTELRHRGRVMHVQATGFSSSFLLDSADQGRRLFNNDDMSIVLSLKNLLEQLIERGDSFHAGQVLERQRISRDLHDQIGGKILSIIYSAEDKRSRELAQETMDQLREMLRALKKEPVPISNLEAEVKNLAQDVCRSHALELDWASNLTDGSQVITTTHYLNVLNVIRELLTNTVRHADANRVQLQISQDDRSLYLRFKDDGKGFNWDNISMGNGLRNIQSRIEEISASISWDTTDQTEIEILMLLTKDGSTDDESSKETVYGYT